jgi:type 1 glutamine amidotransferase
MRIAAIAVVVAVTLSLSSVAAENAAPTAPPPRPRAEVEAALKQAPRPPTDPRPITLLLSTGKKDHGLNEHDYPKWRREWSKLLGSAKNVTIRTADEFPTKEQLEGADVLIVFSMGDWRVPGRLDLLAEHLAKGKGVVWMHSAICAYKPQSTRQAELIGLSWEFGISNFRHGELDLRLSETDHPITKGLPKKIRLLDETYWPLVGDMSKVTVLGQAEELENPKDPNSPKKSYPMLWTKEHPDSKGRAFVTLQGHYVWSFDDPYYRAILLRGIAWAGGGNGDEVYRFDPLILEGVKLAE